MVQVPAGPWTVSKLFAWWPEDSPNRYELLDGELVILRPPRFAHQYAAGTLAFLLRMHLGEEGPLLVVGPGASTYDERNFVLPDLMVVQRPPLGEEATWENTWPPALMIEVASPSTVRRDRGIKRRLALEHGVAEYWVVELRRQQVERWRAADEAPEVCRDAIRWEGGAVPFVLELPTFFERVRYGR
ncbi:MAG: Uma2 family endonuclease [Gemmatimonadales bacterium]|nr:Uma2 family endonuclease [Gemmatimonadales bacterium]